jgi:hypothetical protein
MVRKKNTKADLIRKYIANNPDAKPREIAKALGMSSVYVQQIRYNDKKAALGKQPKAETPEYTTVALIVDPVNHPPHYKSGGIETIDFIEAKGLGYHLGNVVKYISRAGLKGTNSGLEDLKKARWYLDRAIEKNEVARPTA